METQTVEHLVAQRELLANTIRGFYQRGWCLGTGGNFSAVAATDPLELLITPSGVHKGDLTPEQLLLIDNQANVLAGDGKPSAETGIHLTLLEHFGPETVGSILHTHSPLCTALSEAHVSGVAFEGYEMLKGLEGVKTHNHREWTPILENSQDIPALCRDAQKMLRANPGIHGFLLRGHGLYTWGRDILEARRHVEIFEFLFEVMYHRRVFRNLTHT